MSKHSGAVPFILTAGATFSKTDLYKFVSVNSSGHAIVAGSSSPASTIGTLHSVTNTTNAAGSETVTVHALIGVGPVRMAGSTRHVGQTVANSSRGLGVLPSTDGIQIGTIVAGSSGSTGRIVQVAFGLAAAV